MSKIFFWPHQSLPSKKKATSAFIYQYIYILYNFLVIFLTKRNFFLFSQLSLNLYNFILWFVSFPLFCLHSSQYSFLNDRQGLSIHHWVAHRRPSAASCAASVATTPTSWASLRTKSRIDDFGEEWEEIRNLWVGSEIGESGFGGFGRSRGFKIGDDSWAWANSRNWVVASAWNKLDLGLWWCCCTVRVVVNLSLLDCCMEALSLGICLNLDYSLNLMA